MEVFSMRRLFAWAAVVGGSLSGMTLALLALGPALGFYPWSAADPGPRSSGSVELPLALALPAPGNSSARPLTVATPLGRLAPAALASAGLGPRFSAGPRVSQPAGGGGGGGGVSTGGLVPVGGSGDGSGPAPVVPQPAAPPPSTPQPSTPQPAAPSAPVVETPQPAAPAPTPTETAQVPQPSSPRPDDNVGGGSSAARIETGGEEKGKEADRGSGWREKLAAAVGKWKEKSRRGHSEAPASPSPPAETAEPVVPAPAEEVGHDEDDSEDADDDKPGRGWGWGQDDDNADHNHGRGHDQDKHGPGRGWED